MTDNRFARPPDVLSCDIPRAFRTAQGSDSIFRHFVERSLSGMMVVNQYRILYVNAAFKEITGYSDAEIAAMSPWDMVHPDEKDKIQRLGLERFRKQDVREFYETRWIHRKGHEIWVEVRAALFENQGDKMILANIVDITERKLAEKKLKRSEQELQVKSMKLAQTNTALKVLLEQRDEEKLELQTNFVFNIEKLVLPYVSELEQMLSEPRELAYIQTIKSNLEDVISPFLRKLASKYLNLTPKQIQVINLIRRGRLSKEIAEIMGVSKAAVDFHRNEIRRKLGLKNKSINLKSYLQALEEERINTKALLRSDKRPCR